MQGFRTKAEVERFSAMMEEMCYIVATKHSGSLKGEHGTGRNVAPYVEMEWGTKVGSNGQSAARCDVCNSQERLLVNHVLHVCSPTSPAYPASLQHSLPCPRLQSDP